MTEAMIEKARVNASKLGLHNVEFCLGEIEQLPVATNAADVAVSNCVLNLVPDKKKAFAETYRVLKPGGHFSISDIVLSGEPPAALLKAAEMYAGCVSGAIDKELYLQIIRETGFVHLELQKERQITLPDDILLHYLTAEELQAFRQSGTGVYSITVYAKKPACCEPGSGCC
jgi:ubiquinone/menaquinone biosynthesis C-methylase UbiE